MCAMRILGIGWECCSMCVTMQVLDGALEDIQKKRHKRDPFREGYLRLCLSSFQPAAEVPHHACMVDSDVIVCRMKH